MTEEKQVLVTFITKLPEELHVPATEVVRGWLLLLVYWQLLLLLVLLVFAGSLNAGTPLINSTACSETLTQHFCFRCWPLLSIIIPSLPPFACCTTSPRHTQAVPASLKRYGLSQIINHLLALGKSCCLGGTV